MRMKPLLRAAGLIAALTLCGCGSAQSALNAEGQAAIALKWLIVLIVLVCALVWAAVVAVLFWALLRRRKEAAAGKEADHRLRLAVYSALAATAIIVAGLSVASFYATRTLYAGSPPQATVHAKAQQWWWQFTYEDAQGRPLFSTANELHIPVGKDVLIVLESLDVIHSLWIPALAGKQDMIPGRRNELRLHAIKPGIYRGQCAEFCGIQHSHMALVVVAEDENDYAAWLAEQQKPAEEPSSAEAAAGRAVFLAKPCAACHAVRGTAAKGSTGPDLTHIGSRQTLGAGLLDVTRGSLAAWIADPQTLKPGNNMPLVPLSSEELQQVSAYLEGLR